MKLSEKAKNYLNNSDKILTHKVEINPIFVRVFEQFQSRPIIFLEEFNFRECENYLRDGNDIPSMMEDSPHELDQWKEQFIDAKAYFLANVVADKMHTWSMNDFVKPDSLVNKNRSAIHYFDEANKRLQFKSKIQFVLYNESEIHFISTDIWQNSLFFKIILSSIFAESDENSLPKVVVGR